ncbi:MAG: hypothetical protein Q7S77_00760 [Candidatus Staskawiczbacteria bacterium]|nr:hypothetical protein [Candidatus Staskawiczbacteria bacterium]
MKTIIILLILPLVLSGCAYKIVKDDSNNSDNRVPVKQESASLTPQAQIPVAPIPPTGDKTEAIDYTQATNFVGENKTVRGAVVKVYYSAKSDTTFLDFCASYNGCPFSSVIFSSDKSKFGNINQYEGKTVEITGLVTTYKGGAEIILKNPSQINVVK